MPNSFLNLPREIRDIIYEYALISRTGYITPIPDKSSRSPRFSVHTARELEPAAHSNEIILSDDNTLSLSLPRTCRQIYEETSGLFWSNNTFLFPDLPTLTRTLKSMGQIPSRQIRSISVNLHPRDWRAIRKALALLTSRARHGCFENLHLDLHRSEFGVLTYWKHFGDAGHGERYDEVLEVLRESSKECNFQRSMQVHCGGFDGDESQLGTIRGRPQILFYFSSSASDLLTPYHADLHLAFGGRMIYDGRLEWNNYEHVGNCAGSAIAGV